MDDLAWLPLELAAYKAAQKSDANTLVFHGELSPYSNFHNSPFIYDGQHYPMAEHYIQFSKAMFFRDTHIANAILRAKTPYEAKKLSYQINGVSGQEWYVQGYDICYKGV